MGLIRDLWHGDVPLVKAYWLFHVLAGILLKIAFACIEYQPAIVSTAIGATFVLFLGFFAFAYSVFISLAIWRSANTYQGPQLYAILAKISVTIGVMLLIKAAIEIFFVTPS